MVMQHELESPPGAGERHKSRGTTGVAILRGHQRKRDGCPQKNIDHQPIVVATEVFQLHTHGPPGQRASAAATDGKGGVDFFLTSCIPHRERDAGVAGLHLFHDAAGFQPRGRLARQFLSQDPLDFRLAAIVTRVPAGLIRARGRLVSEKHLTLRVDAFHAQRRLDFGEQAFGNTGPLKESHGLAVEVDGSRLLGNFRSTINRDYT